MSETFRFPDLRGMDPARNLGGRQKLIASLTLTIGFTVLVSKVLWVSFLSPTYRRYGEEDWLLIFALSLIVMLVFALVRSAGRVAASEAEWQDVQRALQESQARLHAVVRSLPVGVAVAEASSHRIVLSNDQFRHLWRVSDSEQVSIATGADLGYRQDGRAYETKDWPLARALENGEVTLDKEIWIKRGDGTRGCVSTNAAPIRDENGEISAAVVALTDITDRKAAEAERDRLTRRLLKAQEEERLRIARELHDELGQDLTALSLGLKSLEPVLQDDAKLTKLAELRAIVEHMSVEVHSTASSLRPTSLTDLGLRQALDCLVASWAERLGIAADAHLEGLDEQLSDEGQVVIYRVVQEALTNIAKHSGANSVSVTAQWADGIVRVAVEDDGRGFDPSDPTPNEDKHMKSLGLSGMRERLALVGGYLSVETAPGQGTTVYAALPTSPSFQL
ncbi:PAS domain-containing sensor histidine kinase [Pseudaminobacter soli (ex Li et al. 2025)]|nr:ATP-binding protein [Mesorhizobium soli]